MKSIFEWLLAFVLSLIIHCIFKVDQGKVFFVMYITSGTILTLLYVFWKGFKEKELSAKETADTIVVFVLGTLFSLGIVFITSRVFKVEFYTAFQMVMIGYALRTLREKKNEGGSES